MVGKKGYVRTLEMLIAVVLTFLFLTYLISRVSHEDKQLISTGVLSSLEQKDDFRNCANTRNLTCVESLVDEKLPARYRYDIRIMSNPDEAVNINVSKDVFTESVFIAGNDTTYNTTIVRLFYWVS